MSSQFRRIIFNTRERCLSSDFNDMTNLLHRGIMELFASVAGRQGGVMHGLIASVDGVGLDVTISPGLALFDSGGATADDSDFDWIELEAAETVTLSAADPTNPRWDVIEITAADNTELSSLRDVFNPALGTFTPQTLEKRRRSEPTLTVRAGTPAATPEFPAGVAGSMPLAYVYVPASAVNLTVGDEVLCRPVVRATEGALSSRHHSLRGGGVNIAVDGLDVSFREAEGFFPSTRRRWSMASASTYTLAAAGVDGGSLPVADDVLYAYAVPPPYPTGYDSTLALREWQLGSNAATRIPAYAVDGLEGAVVVFSATEPDVDSSSGAPSGVGTFSLAGAPFGTTTAAHSDAVYLGATFFDQSAGDLLAQTVRTGGMVFPDSTAAGNPIGQVPILDLFPSGAFETTGSYSLWNPPTSAVVTSQFQFPTTALELTCILDNEANAANNWEVRIADEAANGTSTNSPQIGIEWDPAGTGNIREGLRYTIYPSATGTVTLAANSGTVGTTVQRMLFMVAYRDQVIAGR